VSPRATVILSRHWHDARAELGFVARALAGAATRIGTVAVLAPGPAGTRSADGAFDIEGVGVQDLRWPDELPSDSVTFVDELTRDVANLLDEATVRRVFYFASDHQPDNHSWRPLRLVGEAGPGIVRVYVPVNHLAERHRHNGFGFTGYELVLAGNEPVGDAPPPEAAWITAAFHDRDVVVVEDGTASAWKGRALRGRVAVDTRMDLWRLVAHANVCIDLAPGPHLARECVEAMRFGTPVVVRQDSGAAATHVGLGGGFAFADTYELLSAVSRLHEGAARAGVSARARHYASASYGSPDVLVTSLLAVLESR
jgi:hypothetical protein